MGGSDAVLLDGPHAGPVEFFTAVVIGMGYRGSRYPVVVERSALDNLEPALGPSEAHRTQCVRDHLGQLMAKAKEKIDAGRLDSEGRVRIAGEDFLRTRTTSRPPLRVR